MASDSDDLDSALRSVVNIYFRMKYKAPNYSDTYTRPALEDCMDFIKGRVMYLMCAEVQTEKQELDEWMKEETELKDSINMSIDANNDRIIRIKEHMKKYDKEK